MGTTALGFFAGAVAFSVGGVVKDRPPHDRFGLLLVMLLGVLVLTALDRSRLVETAIAVVYLMTIAVAAGATAVRSFHWAAYAVGGGAIATLALVLSPFDGDVARGLLAVAQAIIAAGALAAVVGRVLQHDKVRGETIAGAICAYLLIGLLFASGYHAADLFGSNPVFGHSVSDDEYVYFSYVTLTTTGYGDLVPSADLAQRVVIIEAMTGQIFLATLVARLVTLFRPRRGSGSADR